MKRKIAAAAAILLLGGCSDMNSSSPKGSYDGKSAESQRLSGEIENSARIYKELLAMKDNEIPQKLVDKANCVAVLPEVVQGAFIVGGKYGTGVVACKNNGTWTAPAFLQLSAASLGFQIGADVSNLVLFFVGDKATESLYTSNITLGGDVTVAAGPVGRTAQGKTDFTSSGIYVYAKSKGLFAGISLEGGVLTPDITANEAYYGRPLKNRHILSADSDVIPPADAQELLSALSGGTYVAPTGTASGTAEPIQPTRTGSNPFFGS